ncbi:MAG: alanine--tRNA ligase-related protein [Opitutales bacterium]|jgi:alanyl-tRNA synthetase
MTQKQISGEDAFRLYDTYGFPLDLTQLLAAERGLSVDTDGFNAEMEKQRQRARAAHRSSVISVADEGGAAEATPFVGYEHENMSDFAAEVVEIGQSGDQSFIIFNQSPFYAEMGGQMGDQGLVRTMDGWQDRVLNTVKDSAGRILHLLENPAPEGMIGQLAALSVDFKRRAAIERHHTGTHILHWALRSVLGPHVRQAGSLVTNERLRFDFAHYEAVSDSQLALVERMCNERILANEPVCWLEFDYENKPEGAMAFFGDKYGSQVRVVAIGEDVSGDPDSFEDGWSVELCGGTHVCATGEIGLMKIVQESAVSAGTRRIEAVCGEAAYRLAREQFDLLHRIAGRMSCKPEEIESRLEARAEHEREMEKKLKELERMQSAAQADRLAAAAVKKKGLKLLAALVDSPNPNAMRQLAVDVQNKLGENSVVVLASCAGAKGSLLALCGADAIKTGHKAGSIVSELTGKLGGRGGGKPDYAMGGFSDTTSVAQVLKEFLKA